MAYNYYFVAILQMYTMNLTTFTSHPKEDMLFEPFARLLQNVTFTRQKENATISLTKIKTFRCEVISTIVKI